MELITSEVLAARIRTYLQQELVEWAENAMMEGEFEETEDYSIRDITGRLGVADVKAFSLGKEDFAQFLSQLEHTPTRNRLVRQHLPHRQ